MKKIFYFLFTLVSLNICAQEKYMVTTDLTKVKKDRIFVTLTPPKIHDTKATYVMPSVIPGSYAIKDYGRFITGFKAFNSAGKALSVEKEGNNLFHITGPDIARVQYWVDDTWDSSEPNFIFQPGGTNIEAGKNYVLNHQGMWGYFEGYKQLPYEIRVKRQPAFYPATTLSFTSNATEDVFHAPDYVKLVDNPIMYSAPDTTSFMSGNTRVTVSVFSETGKVKSAAIAKMVTPLASALTDFFGQMPVERYNFIMYFPSASNRSITSNGGFGALEHSYCSFYFLPEMEQEEMLRSMVLSVAAHEFLHILTPLNIHSEEIEYFDFRNPKMSQHLWLYEGVTEYFANLVQLRDSLFTFEDFIEEIQSKIQSDSEFPPVSFTEMSQNILKDPYKDMYQNVYYKGALIGFFLDIIINEASNGKDNLRNVLMKLANKYGPNKPFKDDELFDEIIALTGPAVTTFIENHIIGSEPLPYKPMLEKLGISFVQERTDSLKTFGVLNFDFNQKTREFFVTETTRDANVFGLENGDVIITVNGTEVTMNNFEELLGPIIITRSPNPITVKYKRGNKISEVKASPLTVGVTAKNLIQLNEDLTEEQKQMRLWMFGRIN